MRGQLRQASKKEYRRSLPAMFVCSAFLQYFLNITIAPLVMGHKTAPAFVTTKKTKVVDNHLTTTKTRNVFDHQNIEKQVQRKNSIDIVMKGIAPAGRSSSPTTRSNDSSTELSALSSSMYLCAPSDDIMKRNNWENSSDCRNKSYKVYCDMDGCLVNFEKGVRVLLKTGSSNLDKQFMWEGISRAPLWFEQLEWQMDGKRLWSAIKHLNPDILTGVPDIKSSRVEKFNWCKRELGLKEADTHHVDMAADGSNDHQSVNGNLPREDKTNIITCWSNNKYKECNKHGSILIDDRIDLKKKWEAAGGIFIHHVNTETTIRKLHDLGVILEGQLENGDDDWYWEDSWRLWKID